MNGHSQDNGQRKNIYMDVLVEEFEKCNLKKKKGAHIQAFINQEKRAYDK